MPSECQILLVSAKNAIRLKVLSSHKKGESRVVPMNSPRLCTQSQMFLGTLKGLYSRALNFKKPVTVFRVKKGGVLFAVDRATKNRFTHAQMVLFTEYKYFVVLLV